MLCRPFELQSDFAHVAIMKRLLLSSITLLALSSCLHAQTAPDAPELTKLLEDFLAGASRNDAAMHERFWAARPHLYRLGRPPNR